MCRYFNGCSGCRQSSPRAAKTLCPPYAEDVKRAVPGRDRSIRVRLDLVAEILHLEQHGVGVVLICLESGVVSGAEGRQGRF